MSQICGKYGGTQKCYTETEKDLWDILIAIIIAILEEILEPDISYMRADYDNEQLTVYIQKDPEMAKILTQAQTDNVMELCAEALEEMDFTLSIPIGDFEILYEED